MRNDLDSRHYYAIGCLFDFANRTILFVFYFLFSFSLHSIIYILLFILYADFTLNFTLDFTLNFTFFASKPLFVGIPVGNGIGKNTRNDLGNFGLILRQILFELLHPFGECPGRVLNVVVSQYFLLLIVQ